LTNAKDFPRWNSTVTSIQGDIREGQQIKINIPGTERAFTPKVSGVVPNERMTWTGGFAPMFKGVRTFELKRRGDGTTDFGTERLRDGIMLNTLKKFRPQAAAAKSAYVTG
jgi:hypothetical protein